MKVLLTAMVASAVILLNVSFVLATLPHSTLGGMFAVSGVLLIVDAYVIWLIGFFRS